MNLELWNIRHEDGTSNGDTSSLFLEDVEWTAVTYFDLVRVKFTSREAMLVAQKLTGWEEWDDDQLVLKRKDGRVDAKGIYYADWGTNA